jgi:hypothetical protein
MHYLQVNKEQEATLKWARGERSDKIEAKLVDDLKEVWFCVFRVIFT